MPVDESCTPEQREAIRKLNSWMALLAASGVLSAKDEKLRDKLQQLVEDFYYT